MPNEIKFDAATARVFNRRPGGSRHFAYEDHAGSVCLWCRSELARGGVAISASAVEWLGKQEGAKFIRLTNAKSSTDIVLPLEEVPFGQERIGPTGVYHIIDPDVGGKGRTVHRPFDAPRGDQRVVG